jgi:hypothetical protein
MIHPHDPSGDAMEINGEENGSLWLFVLSMDTVMIHYECRDEITV